MEFRVQRAGSSGFKVLRFGFSVRERGRVREDEVRRGGGMEFFLVLEVVCSFSVGLPGW